MELKDHPTDYLTRIKAALDALDTEKIAALIARLETMIGTDQTLYIAGNGGSASTSSHMMCDLSKTILGKKPRENSKRLRVLSINDHIPLMTAWGNDEGYEYIFSEQLRNIGRKGDVLLIITGSGNSKNILEVISVAKSLGMHTVGFLGFDGGKAKAMLDEHIIVDSFDYGIVEDVHHIFNHLITDWLKKKNGVN